MKHIQSQARRHRHLSVSRRPRGHDRRSLPRTRSAPRPPRCSPRFPHPPCSALSAATSPGLECADARAASLRSEPFSGFQGEAQSPCSNLWALRLEPPSHALAPQPHPASSPLAPPRPQCPLPFPDQTRPQVFARLVLCQVSPAFRVAGYSIGTCSTRLVSVLLE